MSNLSVLIRTEAVFLGACLSEDCDNTKHRAWNLTASDEKNVTQQVFVPDCCFSYGNDPVQWEPAQTLAFGFRGDLSLRRPGNPWWRGQSCQAWPGFLALILGLP